MTPGSLTADEERFLKGIFPSVWIDEMIENGDFAGLDEEEMENGN